MPAFDGTATSEEFVDTFSSEVTGRTFVITGASEQTIGSSMAITLARASPKHILIASRTPARADSVIAATQKVNPTVKASFVQVDLSDHQTVRRAAKEILDATSSKIDVLINSAGVAALKEYATDKQGIEMQLSANHAGHFLLTNLLVPGLRTAAAADKGRGARVIHLTSNGHQISPFRFDDYNFSGGKTYVPWTGYGQSKTANILFSYGLMKRLQSFGIISLAVHPGSNYDTKLVAHLNQEDYGRLSEITRRNTGNDFIHSSEPRVKTYAQIGATPLVAALDPDLASKAPAYMNNCQVAPAAEYARDPNSVERLWKLSEELVKESFEY